MKKESIQALVERYNQIKAEKKEEKRLLALLKKKELHRDEVMQGRSDRAKEHRKIVMYELHKKRQKRKNLKAYRKLRRKIINHRYYVKHRRRPRIRRRLHKGDELGRFIIFYTKDYQYNGTYGWYSWKLSAFERFKKLVDENHASVICPIKYNYSKSEKKNDVVKYEILLKKKIDPSESKNETVFRDSLGMNVTVKTDDPNWAIIAKDDWYVEEQFYVYGYHPIYDQKDAPFIIDNIIKKYAEEDGMCRLFIWKKYLFIENSTDFTFALTKTHKEAIRLYNILSDKLEKVENIYFTGTINSVAVYYWIDRMKEKTGWSEHTITHCCPIA